jgi:hypothetical protein
MDALNVHYPMFSFLKKTNFVGKTFSNIILQRRHPIHQVSIVKYIDKRSVKLIIMGFGVKNRKTYLDRRNATHHVKYLTLQSREVRRNVQWHFLA